MRGFRTRSAATIVMAALQLALAGCASGDRAARRTTLVFTGLAGEPRSLNPLLAWSADLSNLSHLYLSDLVESDDRGNLVPEIAVTVPTRANGGISADGRTIVYHLRAGARWQDGAPLTAADVAFSYRAVMNPANNVPSRVAYAEVDALRTPDARTVVVHLRRPFSPIVAYFCAPEGYPIFPAHLLARYPSLNHVDYNQRPVGSGPYRVLDWRHGDSISFEANASYWRGKPHITRLLYRIVPDPSTRVRQLITGESDAYFDVDPQVLPQLRAIPNVRVVLTPMNDIHILEFNLRDPVVGDVRLRRAIARAIDRKKLISVATYGSGFEIDGDQPRNGWGFAARLPAVGYDPAGARRILDDAGWRVGPGGTRIRGGRPLELGLAISPQGVNGSPLVATVIQDYLRAVGIAVAIKPYTPALMWGPLAAGGVLASGRYQLAYNAWWVLGPDPDDSWQFACEEIPPAGWNQYFWCNRRADDAMHDALRTFDRARRIRDYATVQTELHRDLPEVTLWQVRMPDAYRPGLRGFSPSPFGSTFWNAWGWTYGGGASN